MAERVPGLPAGTRATSPAERGEARVHYVDDAPRCACGAIIEPDARRCRPCDAEARGNGNPERARRMLAQGYDVDSIAAVLGISAKTVRNYTPGARRSVR